MRMKRVRLVLLEQLLDEVLRHSGERTLSAAVTVAMKEFVKHAKVRQIRRLRGTGVWEGDLAEMRDDKRPTRSSRKAR